VLLTASLLLSFLNTFVTQAVSQLNHDVRAETQDRMAPNVYDTAAHDLSTGVTLDEITQKIKSMPVQFTDVFPCCLQRTNQNGRAIAVAIKSEEGDNNC